MRCNLKKLIVSVLLILSMLVSMVPNVLLADALSPVTNESDSPTESVQPDSSADSGTEDDEIAIPKASDIEHVHNSNGWNCSFECKIPDHTHDEENCEKEWVCETEYVLLTVEYFITVNDQEIRAASTYRALLTNGDEYKVPVEDLRKDGYKVDVAKRYVAGQESTPEEIAVMEENQKYYVSGKIAENTKIIVNYVYQKEYAPYKVEYWGYSASGKDQVILYSYTGMGKKDSQISASQDGINTETISISVNDLMKNLYDILGNQAQLGNSGEKFIEKLINAVNEKYLSGNEGNKDTIYHDITPLLEHIAGVKKSDDLNQRKNKLNSLTRLEIKNYIANNLVKVYGFDYDSQQIWDAKLTVTADELAVRNLYYIQQKPQTALFMTGLSNAEVVGIPEKPFDSEVDADNIALNYDIKLSKNYITALPTVDIHKYTENIYAKHQSYVFVGWVTGEDAEVITDYTPTNAVGKYKDLTIYTATGDPAGTSKPSSIPVGIKTKPLADELKKMPDGGTTYYAVWQPSAAPYIVQVWFESEKGDNTYVESHSLDIQRYNEIGLPITFNEFDVNRAKEQSVKEAANKASSAIFDNPIEFEDSDSDTKDVYRSYTDYQNSPFYGFDFLECEVCKADASRCGAEGCKCGKQRMSNADGSEGESTNTDACNYQKVTVKEDGTTVLNLYYTREIWEITMTPSVHLWTVQTLWRPTERNIYTYWLGGKEQTDIKSELQKAKDNNEGITISGKYGTKVDDAYKNGIGWDKVGSGWQSQIGENNNKVTLPANTEVLLVNGSDAFGRGYYLYPQDTLKYTTSPSPAIPDPEDWDLPFHCLSTIEEEMFTNRTNRKNADNTGYVYIQNAVSMWENQRFGEESIYDLLTGERIYGTHELKVYPYYHDISDKEGLSEHTYNINYYLQALPHEEVSAGYTYKTGNGDEINFVKDLSGEGDYSVTIKTPAEMLNYDASTPDGFIPLMWRTSPKGFSTARGGFKGLGTVSAAARYTLRQPCFSSSGGGLQCPLAYFNMNYPKNHNGSFNKYNLSFLGDNTAYHSDWRMYYTYNQPTQDTAQVGSMDPGGYWITDWIRVGNPGEGTIGMDGSLTGENGLYALIDKANQGNKEAKALLDQLKSSFSVGQLFPTGEDETIYYLSNNPNAFRYSSAGTAKVQTKLTGTENAVAFARNQYSITYNTCFLDDSGELLRDENGIVTTKLYTTKYVTGEDGIISDQGDMVYYDQPLGYNPKTGSNIKNFDSFYLNYYDAYFKRDASKPLTADGAFTFNGCGEKNKTSLGGYGHWYLDPDGKIPFTEENLERMPAGNIDVYYHYNVEPVTIYFIDKVTGKDVEPKVVEFNGEKKTLNNVIWQQEIQPGTPADPIPDPMNDNLYFAGWFYDEAGTDPYDFYMEISEDTIVYAVWKPKVPTDYKIRHVLVDSNGREITELLESKWVKSYVGNTIDARALGTAWYRAGNEYHDKDMYFKVEDYSKSMVLETQNDKHEKNILTFYYTYEGMKYTIEYRDKNNPDIEILPAITTPTKLSQVTVGMTEISGWDYWGYSVDKKEPQVPDKTHVTVKVTTDGVVVTFWYERVPIDGVITAYKLMDDVLSSGTWFSFQLVDESGNVVGTTKSADGIIEFDILETMNINAVGTYRYTLQEVNEKNRINYDDTKYGVVIEVTQPDITKPLEYEVTYYKDGKKLDVVPVFKNYRQPIDVQLTAKKYLDGKLMSGDGFGFLLQGGEGLLDCKYHIHDESCYELQLTCGYEEIDPEDTVEENEGVVPGDGHEHTDDCYEKVLICGEKEDANHTEHDQSCYSARTTLIEEQSASNGEIVFNPLSFDHTGIYVYTIHERNDSNASYEYDDAEYRVAVEVFINERNEMDAKVTITCDGEPVEEIKFENNTVKTPDTTIQVDPNNPAKPDNQNNLLTKKPSNLLTGDSLNFGLYATLVIVSLLGLSVIFYFRKEKTQGK